MARTCASVKVPFRDVPRWPLVPNPTNWLASSRSGLRSKYSFSNLARSTSISLGAGFPANGEILDPLNCVAACFFSNAPDIFHSPISPNCAIVRSPVFVKVVSCHGGRATAELPTLSRDSPVLCCPDYEDLHAGIWARYICIEQRLLIPVSVDCD